jgi:hypothetical protein
MYTNNNKNKCTIYNSLLYQDLTEYDIGENSTSVYLKYSDLSTNSNITLRDNDITSFIDTNVSVGVWTPAIISDETFITNKPLFNKQNITNPILGIENALQFPARFKNWSIEEPNGNASSASMTTNWYITSIIPTAYAEYGLLFWYKNNSITSSSSYLLSDIPNGTIIKSLKALSYIHPIPTGDNYPPTLVDFTASIDTTTELVKLNDNTLKICDKSSNNITGNGISFWYEYDKFYLDKCVDFNIKNDKFTIVNSAINKNNKDFSLWISDGEAFSYFDGITNKNKYRSQSYISKTYLSPFLMSIYREIYHALTLRNIRSVSSGLPINKSALLQKLAYFLSTFPLIDRTTVNILNSETIYNAVQTYLNTTQSSTEQEIAALKTVISVIANEYNAAHLTDGLNKTNIKHNYINSKLDLVKKLLNKYGAQLYIENNKSLKYKSNLPNGPHALLALSSITVAEKNIAKDTVLYNNFKTNIGNISYSSDISTTGSVIILSGSGFSESITIPLIDIAVTKESFPPLTLNNPLNNHYKPFTGTEIVFRNLNSFDPTPDGSFFWEQISGPKYLRFTDYNRDKFKILRYKTSTDVDPDIYIRRAGTYGLRCTRSAGGIVESDEIFITTDPTFSESTADEPPALVNNKIINSVPRKIGFHKHGLVWFVDTDHYIQDDYTKKSISSFGISNAFRLKDDVKIDIPKPDNFVPSSQGDLKFTFLVANGNTKILLDGIGIERARYRNDSDSSQCTSFYNEKIYRVGPKQVDYPVLGTSNFAREFISDYNLKYYNNDGLIFNTSEIVSAPNEVSTFLAPIISGYGGYSQEKVDAIGIRMRDHNVSGTIPLLEKRNDIVNPTNTYCFLKEVKSTSSGITMNKGFFDPLMGFKINDLGNDLSGKSLVIDYDLNKQKSFVFKGNGFLSLKPLAIDNSLNFYTSSIKITSEQVEEAEQYQNAYGYRNYNDPKANAHYIMDGYLDSWDISENFNGVGESQTIYGFPATGTLEPLSGLYIKDINIKLNFLNYTNPKELIIWLDIIPSGSLPSSPSVTDLMNSRTISDYSTNTSLINYYNNLNDLNTLNGSNTRRIYLLNQEYIKNYESNFSITFSDDADKNITTGPLNSQISNEYVGTIPISNNGIIQPTLYSTGYNDIDSELYIGNIKKNQINNINSSLLKFKNIPLKDTVFKLNIGFVNATEYPSTVMDNLLINNIETTTEKINQGSTITNSLCNWEIKINTTDTNKFYNTDILGKINYAGYCYDGLASSAITGYNFIGDFRQTPFLIPAAHTNAPYDYIANINKCLYDERTVGMNWSCMRPSYPENMRTLSLAALSYLTAGASISMLAGAGFAGVAAALYAFDAIYSAGGRNDPIINFLIENALRDVTDAQDSQFYKPVYSSKFFGVPDKAIVAISQDQNYWYTIEVPIFNMLNSHILQKQEYNYIKLINNNVPGISDFKYTIIRNYSDLDLAPTVCTYNTNISSLSGERDGFVEGDMVLLIGQTTSSDNGYYIINRSNWIKVPSGVSSHFLKNNNISNLLIESSLSNQNHILIDNLRAYYFFDKDETVLLNTADGIANATVSGKSYIQTYSGTKTVLTLNIAIAKNGTISKDATNANVLWLYKKNIGYPDSDSVNKWLMTKTKNEKAENLYPYNFATAYGEGSINSGSDILNPDILSKMSFNHSELLETNKLLNNELNDKYKYNRVFLSGMPPAPAQNGQPPPTSPQNTIIAFSGSDLGTSLLKGYSYTLENFISKPYNSYIDTIGTGVSFKLQNTVFDMDWSDRCFMEIKSDKFKGPTTIPDIGSLYIENDFKKIIPIYFSSGDLTILTNRLNTLYTGILPGLYADYYSTNAQSAGSSYQNIKINESERTNIEIALSVPHSPSGFISCVSGSVSTGVSGVVTINYDINPYLYWIHIDPEQKCKLNDELSVKVLEKIRMRAVPLAQGDLDQGVVPGTDSHIVPPQGFMGIPSGTHNASGVSMVTDGPTYTYNMHPTTIQNDKNKWSSTINWSNVYAFTYGDLRTAGDSKKLMVSRLDSDKDMLVMVEENYIKPTPPQNAISGKVKNFIDFTQPTIYLKFRNIPRKLKSIDSEDFDRYIYDRNGNTFKSSVDMSSVGQIANNFTCWHCVDSSGNFTSLPPYYQAANEMRYRAFFGSNDGIENKNTIFLDTKEDWEWIPYEYYSGSTFYFNPAPTDPTPLSVQSSPLSASSQIMSFANWSDINNWYTDSSFQQQASTLPSYNDIVIINDSINIDTTVNIRQIIVNTSGVLSGGNIKINESATFNGSGYLKYDSSLYLDKGNIIFNDDSHNQGQINIKSGNILFNKNSSNRKDAKLIVSTGTIIFRDNSVASGEASIIYDGNIQFYNKAQNHATLKITSPILPKVSGDTEILDTGGIDGKIIFNDESINTINGTIQTPISIFNNNTVNSGSSILTDIMIFGDSSINDSDQSMFNDFTVFKESSINQGTGIINNILFKDESQNHGAILINRDRRMMLPDNSFVFLPDRYYHFIGKSKNFGTIGYSVTFGDSSMNFGPTSNILAVDDKIPYVYFSGSSVNSGTLGQYPTLIEQAYFNGDATNLGYIKSKNILFYANSVNGGYLEGIDIRFNQTTRSTGTITTLSPSAVLFFDTSSVGGRLYGNAIFHDKSSVDIDGNILSGNSTFNYLSINKGILEQDSIFNHLSENAGYIFSNASFYNSSKNTGTVARTGLFCDSSTNIGKVGFFKSCTTSTSTPN